MILPDQSTCIAAWSSLPAWTCGGRVGKALPDGRGAAVIPGQPYVVAAVTLMRAPDRALRSRAVRRDTNISMTARA